MPVTPLPRLPPRLPAQPTAESGASPARPTRAMAHQVDSVDTQSLRLGGDKEFVKGVIRLQEDPDALQGIALQAKPTRLTALLASPHLTSQSVESLVKAFSPKQLSEQLNAFSNNPKVAQQLLQHATPESRQAYFASEANPETTKRLVRSMDKDTLTGTLTQAHGQTDKSTFKSITASMNESQLKAFLTDNPEETVFTATIQNMKGTKIAGYLKSIQSNTDLYQKSIGAMDPDQLRAHINERDHYETRFFGSSIQLAVRNMTPKQFSALVTNPLFAGSDNGIANHIVKFATDDQIKGLTKLTIPADNDQAKKAAGRFIGALSTQQLSMVLGEKDTNFATLVPLIPPERVHKQLARIGVSDQFRKSILEQLAPEGLARQLTIAIEAGDSSIDTKKYSTGKVTLQSIFEAAKPKAGDDATAQLEALFSKVLTEDQSPDRARLSNGLTHTSLTHEIRKRVMAEMPDTLLASIVIDSLKKTGNTAELESIVRATKSEWLTKFFANKTVQKEANWGYASKTLAAMKPKQITEQLANATPENRKFILDRMTPAQQAEQLKTLFAKAPARAGEGAEDLPNEIIKQLATDDKTYGALLTALGTTPEGGALSLPTNLHWSRAAQLFDAAKDETKKLIMAALTDSQVSTLIANSSTAAQQFVAKMDKAQLERHLKSASKEQHDKLVQAMSTDQVGEQLEGATGARVAKLVKSMDAAQIQNHLSAEKPVEVAKLVTNLTQDQIRALAVSEETLAPALLVNIANQMTTKQFDKASALTLKALVPHMTAEKLSEEAKKVTPVTFAAIARYATRAQVTALGGASLDADKKAILGASPLNKIIAQVKMMTGERVGLFVNYLHEFEDDQDMMHDLIRAAPGTLLDKLPKGYEDVAQYHLGDESIEELSRSLLPGEKEGDPENKVDDGENNRYQPPSLPPTIEDL